MVVRVFYFIPNTALSIWQVLPTNDEVIDSCYHAAISL